MYKWYKFFFRLLTLMILTDNLIRRQKKFAVRKSNFFYWKICVLKCWYFKVGNAYKYMHSICHINHNNFHSSDVRSLCLMKFNIPAKLFLSWHIFWNKKPKYYLVIFKYQLKIKNAKFWSVSLEISSSINLLFLKSVHTMKEWWATNHLPKSNQSKWPK